MLLSLLAAFELEVPYGGTDPSRPYYLHRNSKKVIQGRELAEQLQKWVDYGTIEQSAADAIRECSENKQWLDLSDRYFVILGATRLTSFRVIPPLQTSQHSLAQRDGTS